jgi:hypothetical protein
LFPSVGFSLFNNLTNTFNPDNTIYDDDLRNALFNDPCLCSKVFSESFFLEDLKVYYDIDKKTMLWYKPPFFYVLDRETFTIIGICERSFPYLYDTAIDYNYIDFIIDSINYNDSIVNNDLVVNADPIVNNDLVVNANPIVNNDLVVNADSVVNADPIVNNDSVVNAELKRKRDLIQYEELRFLEKCLRCC